MSATSIQVSTTNPFVRQELLLLHFVLCLLIICFRIVLLSFLAEGCPLYLRVVSGRLFWLKHVVRCYLLDAAVFDGQSFFALTMLAEMHASQHVGCKRSPALTWRTWTPKERMRYSCNFAEASSLPKCGAPMLSVNCCRSCRSLKSFTRRPHSSSLCILGPAFLVCNFLPGILAFPILL